MFVDEEAIRSSYYKGVGAFIKKHTSARVKRVYSTILKSFGDSFDSDTWRVLIPGVVSTKKNNPICHSGVARWYVLPLSLTTY